MEIEDLRRLLDDKTGLARFGPIPPTMRTIRNHSDLEALRKAGVGFIINIRPEDGKIHRVNCEATEVMSTSAHPKIFGEIAKDVVEWVTTDRAGAWENCGLCGGLGELATHK
jgi:hypothetical protein